MTKIKVIQYAKGVGYSGTHKVSQVMSKYLDKNEFDVYLLYRRNDDISRLGYMQTILGGNHVIEFKHEHGVNESPYLPKKDNFLEVVKSISPDIIHGHRAGNEEWPFLPFLKDELPDVKFVETHIFDRIDDFPWDARLFICNYIARRCDAIRLSGNNKILYNPVEMPYCGKHNRSDRNHTIFGRIGRPDNFCDISLVAMRNMVDMGIKNFEYRIVNPCDRWKETVKELGLQEYCKLLPPIYDDRKLSRFYASIDVFAHARSDGEINSTAISEAQIHGVPVVTHQSPCYNGQEEQVANARGFIVGWQDYAGYENALIRMMVDHDIYDYMSKGSEKWAIANVEASVIVEKLENIYKEIMNGLYKRF